MNRLSIARMAGTATPFHPGYRSKVGFENRQQANTLPTHPTHPTHFIPSPLSLGAFDKEGEGVARGRALDGGEGLAERARVGWKRWSQ